MKKQRKWLEGYKEEDHKGKVESKRERERERERERDSTIT